MVSVSNVNKILSFRFRLLQIQKMLTLKVKLLKKIGTTYKDANREDFMVTYICVILYAVTQKEMMPSWDVYLPADIQLLAVQTT